MRKKIFFAQFILFSLFSALTFAQNIQVTGKVTEENGNPIAGATISVKGSNLATVSNDQGAFSLNVKQGASLAISYVGYGSKTVIANGSDLTISLSSQTNDLNEVVVTALGIRKEKKALGYSVTEVKGDELTEARTTNIANSLVGKVAGLNIASTANGPGGSTRITIRGNGSISQENQPLIVVDGIPISNDNPSRVGMWGGQDGGDGISSLNPDEIESISVLKGGTAAALYGSRASNGAILVTTKGGTRNGKGVGVEVNSNIVAEDLLYKTYKDYQYEYGTGDNGLKPTSADPNLNQTNSFGARLDGSDVIQFDGVARPYVAQRDNLKKFYDVGSNFTNSVALSGGSEKIAYRLSFSDLTARSIMPNSSLKRDNLGLNLNGTLSKKLSFIGNIKYVKEKTRNRPKVSDSPGNANYAITTMPSSLDVETLKQSKYVDSNGFERVYTDNQYVTNPWYAAYDFIQEDTRDRVITSFEPKFQITDWLFVKGRIGFDKYTQRNTAIEPTGTGYKLGGEYHRQLRDFNETNAELLLGFNKDLTSKINLSAFAGGNQMRNVNKQDNSGSIGNGGPFNIPFFYDPSNIDPARTETRYYYSEKRINSVYGSVDLSYNDLLYLNLTGRNDYFSTLGKGKNSIFYPSVGLSFILSEAIKLPSSINYAKIRGSWAQVGGGANDPYLLDLNYSLNGNHLGSPLAQINQTQVPNKLLQPLLSTSSEIGFEGRLFNSSLGFDIALYNRKTTDDIVGASISGASGYSNALFNVGEINNKGIEALINYKIIDGKKFSWQTSVNVGYNKNEVKKIYGDLDKIQVDEPRSRSVYIFQALGMPFSQILGNAFKRNQAGQIMHDDDTGLPLTENLKAFGSGVSPTTLGFNNSFRIGGIGVSFLLDAKFGGYIYSGTNALATRYGLHKMTLPGRETGVVGEGVMEDGKTANSINVTAKAWYSNLYNFAEPFVYKSDFIKLRQVIIDYTLPTRLLGNSFVKGASVSIVGRNLWTIKKYVPNIDPESNYNPNSQGLEFVGLPATRTVGFNVNLKF